MAKAEEQAESPMAPYVVEDYDPVFDRSGIHRRVLGHITDEDHVGRGPRNTVDRLAQELEEDPFTEINASEVQTYLDELEAEGLIAEDDGTYAVTEAGKTELAN